MQELAVVVPCYNEGARLDDGAIAALIASPDTHAVMVDDGSTDNTAERLQRLAAHHPGRISVVAAERNGGKAEAVRLGLRYALKLGAGAVGYLDADMSTPPAEFRRLWKAMQARNLDMVLGSRVALLGRRVERHAWRHYLGRVFATAAARILDLCVYDTQCGAKIIRRSPALLAAVDEPFVSRWAFDIELIGRLVIGTDAVRPVPVEGIAEIPLETWTDVPGSKLHVTGMAKTALDLAKVAADLSRRRRAGRAAA